MPVVDSSGRDVDMTRLWLALHVAEAYRLFFEAAACAPVPVSGCLLWPMAATSWREFQVLTGRRLVPKAR